MYILAEANFPVLRDLPDTFQELGYLLARGDRASLESLSSEVPNVLIFIGHGTCCRLLGEAQQQVVCEACCSDACVCTPEQLGHSLIDLGNVNCFDGWAIFAIACSAAKGLGPAHIATGVERSAFFGFTDQILYLGEPAEGEAIAAAVEESLERFGAAIDVPLRCLAAALSSAPSSANPGVAFEEALASAQRHFWVESYKLLTETPFNEFTWGIFNDWFNCFWGDWV